MLNDVHRYNEAIKLNSDIGVQPCFLFIGKNADSSLLTDKILRKKWAGVVSTSDKILISDFKIPGRELLHIRSVNEIHPNRVKMPFIYLNEVIEINPDDSEEDQSRDFSEEEALKLCSNVYTRTGSALKNNLDGSKIFKHLKEIGWDIEKDKAAKSILFCIK